MSTDTHSLQVALSAFICAPTSEKLQLLNEAATSYRERWIESRSAAAESDDSKPGSDGESTRYKRLIFVHGNQPDGTELVLALQSRTSRREGHTWQVVSWRTRLKPGGHNRRFYMTAGHAWSMPADLALEMMESLRKKGGLDERYDDKYRRPDFNVSMISTSNHSDAVIPLTEVTMEGESWGPRTQGVVATDPNVQWRKVMLFDPDTRLVTFRSLTKDTNYMPRADLRPGSEWFLDNSMQDSNVQQARLYLDSLQTFVASN